MFPTSDRLRFPFRVTAVGPGYIDLDRPLPVDVRLAWRPAVYPFGSTASHSGLEHFSVQFRWAT